MKKKRKTGASHYRAAGLKPILIYVRPALHAKLKKLAEKKGKSLQETGARIWDEHFKKR